jgi:DNA mismatch endonuclease (patch repair protein)
MLSNRSRDTDLELRVRSALHRAGYRYFKHRFPVQGLRCQADLVFPTLHLAVFFDGCFWHGCQQHPRTPSQNARNRDWWVAKLERNVARDRRNSAALEAAGWHVLRIWEHEPIAIAVARVAAAVEEVRAASPPSVER